MFEDIVIRGAEEMGVPLDEVSPVVLRRFYDFLEEKNQVMDLTAIKGEEDQARSNFLDSLSISPFIPAGSTLIDVGTGAGFPGIPLAIVRRDIDVTLMESMQKRCNFLQEAARLEGMPKMNILVARAEEAGQMSSCREQFDVVTARGVAKLSVLAEFCMPLVKPGGLFIAMKGPGAGDELKAAKKGIEILGGGMTVVKGIQIPGSDRTRCAVVIEKAKPTPATYPRKYNRISKAPLG